MAKSTPQLDTPYKKGERVLTTRPLPGIVEGTVGKVKLVNGFDQWNRYWVRFEDGRLVGQIDHEDLVRPFQLHDWRDREVRRAEAALQPEAEAAGGESETAAVGGGDGVASQIPAHLLERSRAAKARLTGG